MSELLDLTSKESLDVAMLNFIISLDGLYPFKVPYSGLAK